MSSTVGLLLSLAVLGLLRPCRCTAARDSLPRGASIAVEDYASNVLRSPDGTFSCGFYNVSTTVFTLSVWFARAAGRTVVWTANRGRPVHSRGARLALDRRGGALVLRDYDGETVWNATAEAPGASRARLLDSGNLVLEDAGGNTVWQSFDHPTDTLLPTQRITAGKRLVSGDGALGSGYYSLGFSDYAMLSLFYDNHNVSSIYWPNPYFSYVINHRKIYNFTREAAMDALGQFTSSDNASLKAADLGGGVKRRLTLDTDGNLRLYSLDDADRTWTVAWVAFGNPCTIHGVCGANAVCRYVPAPACACVPGHRRADARDWRRGCEPAFLYDCRRRMKLVALPRTDFWGYDLNDADVLPLAACAKKCLDDCACVAFHHNEQFATCYLKSVMFNGRAFPGLPGTLYLKVPADFHLPELHVRQWQAYGDLATAGCASGGGNAHVLLNVSGVSSRRDGDRIRPVWLYLYGFLSALLVVEALVVGLGCWLFSKKGLFQTSRVCTVDEGYRLITSHFRGYSYTEIKRATGDFADEIGRGGSGAVYRGVLDDDRAIAVKVLQEVGHSEEVFQAELSVIARIYHMNLVRMWGFCSEGNHRILVSEYIENGSLATVLFPASNSGALLRWPQRYNVALGVAKGLAYLHDECLEWIIHCDMKPENILLDEAFEPKITDFGLAKLLNRDGSDSDMSRIRGTRGYMAPEWVSSLPITAKVDVYSYGVVLLELVKGVRTSEWAEGRDLVVKAVREKIGSEGDDEAWIADVVDGRLNGDFNRAQVKTVLEVAVACLEEDRSRRPSMKSVLQAFMHLS